jgi:hypothetical protein
MRRSNPVFDSRRGWIASLALAMTEVVGQIEDEREIRRYAWQHGDYGFVSNPPHEPPSGFCAGPDVAIGPGPSLKPLWPETMPDAFGGQVRYHVADDR